MVLRVRPTIPVLSISLGETSNRVRVTTNGRPLRQWEINRLDGARVDQVETDGELTHTELMGVIQRLGIAVATRQVGSGAQAKELLNIKISGGWTL